jgi:hypothetical protein
MGQSHTCYISCGFERLGLECASPPDGNGMGVVWHESWELVWVVGWQVSSTRGFHSDGCDVWDVRVGMLPSCCDA